MSRDTLKGLLCSALVGISACGPSAPIADYTEYGPYLDSIMEAAGVPGLGFAVFDDGGIIYQHVSGVKDANSREPIDENTAFEAASISKTMFGHVVLSLAADGRLDLDMPLVELVSELPDVAYDSRSRELTARRLLTHQGGFPNWRSRLNFDATEYSELFASGDSLRFVSDPGAEFRYSGEGYVLLQRVVEEHTGVALGDMARRRIFEPLDMARTSFVFDTHMRTNFALGHDATGVPDKWEIGVTLASSTLHTTAADLARFGTHLAKEIRSNGPFAALATPAVTVEDVGGIESEWGLGMGVVTDAGRRYAYHTGNNVIFIADFIYGFDENVGYALLTNSANGQRVADDLELRFFGRQLRE